MERRPQPTNEWNGPPPLTQLGEYILLRRLGKGGMGSVFLAEHARTRDQVAVKVIAPHLAQIPNLAQRFEAEARAVMRVCHPNVIHLEAFGRTDDGLLYQVLELLQGDDLDLVMHNHGRFSAEEALPYVQQICAGLQAAHDRRIVHRDLKPENIFVLHGQPMMIKLLDFGIAKLLDHSDMAHLTATGTIMGSPMFMAPEQAAGDKARIGPCTDIYSLGVILYMMLCGAPPFESEDLQGMLFSHLSLQPTHIRVHDPSISTPVATLVHRCLEKSPGDRPESARQVAEDLAAAIAVMRPGEPSGAPPWPVEATGPGAPGDETVVDLRPNPVHVQTMLLDLDQTGEASVSVSRRDAAPENTAVNAAENAADSADAAGAVADNGADIPLPRHRLESPPMPIPLVAPRRSGWSTTHWLALAVGLLGVTAIVLLVLSVFHILYH